METITVIAALVEVIVIPEDYCIWWETETVMAYFCATPCSGIEFGTTWFANELQAVLEVCILDYTFTGEFYTSGSPFWQAGLEVAGEVTPLYAYWDC